MNLVTGATGILGSHVVLALLQNNEPVVAACQKNSDRQRVEELFSFYTTDYKALYGQIKWVDLDVRDIFSIEDALEGIINVYHCAGFVSFEHKHKNKLKDINEKGTKNIVDACLAKKISALCHVSSVATINNLDYTLPLTEDVFWKKSGKESDYAVSKYNAEREVWRGMEEGLNAVIVNPGVILSPVFFNQSSSKIFDTCYKGNRFYTNGMAGYIAASDVAESMIKLVSQKRFSNRYILVENNYTFHNILSHIQANFKKPLPTINAPGMLLTIISFIEKMVSVLTGRPRQITKAVINAALNKQVYSNEKIKKALSGEFRPVHPLIEQICSNYKLQKTKNQASL